MLTRRLEITGAVQGVGFRYSMQREAVRLGVRGWVRNRRDGSVEAVLCGPQAVIDNMIEAMRSGPPAARVESVERSAMETFAGRGFVSLPTE
ncbi:MAG: acylphosphatase [Dongiaceae bacterium]